MPYMSLGSYTFVRNPSIYTPPSLMTPSLHVAVVETYESVAVFDWGASIAGKPVPLKWAYLPESQYMEFETMALAGDVVPFDPQDGRGKSFNVKIVGLEGRFHYKLRADGGEDVWRSDVTLDLVVLSEVV